MLTSDGLIGTPTTFTMRLEYLSLDWASQLPLSSALGALSSQTGMGLFALKASKPASYSPSNLLIRGLKGWSIFNTMINNGFYLTHLLL